MANRAGEIGDASPHLCEAVLGAAGDAIDGDSRRGHGQLEQLLSVL